MMRADWQASGAILREVFIAGVGQTAVNKDPHSRGRYLGADVALVQNIGGTGATVVTHVLTRES